MIKELLTFRHESDNIPQALGLPEEIDERCREMIHFSCFTSYLITNEFFSSKDETPNNLKTITGVLEKTLGLCKTKEEEIYILFVFRNVHEHAVGAINAYEAYNDETDEKARKKMKMLMELVELKAVLDDKDERKDVITPKDMFKKIEVAKNNMYNFENYYSVINESKNKE
jgi:hypothetical protein